MTVNLSPFLNQNVIATFRNGEVHEGCLKDSSHPFYPYRFETTVTSRTFRENGRYHSDNVTGYDIVEIRLANGIFPGGNSTEKIAMALLPDIVVALQEDEDFQNLLRQKIKRKLDKLLDGGLVDKTFDQVAEVLSQNIVVTTKAR